MFITDKDLQNKEYLERLLRAGFTAITERNYAVVKAESTDDKLIVNMIAELEEKK